MNPFFSIIIPIYNCEKTIELTLYSVMDQTFKDYEIIIINDCSTDNSMQIINNFNDKFNNITIIENIKNLGVAKSRNKGLGIARGKYIALLDGDDIWLPNKLEKQKYIIDTTNCDICCTSYSFINEHSNEIKKPYIIPKIINYKMMIKQNYIGCSTVTVKKNLLSGNSMNSKYFHEDYALWLKLLHKGASIVGIPEPLVKYRISKTSRSFNKVNAAKGRMYIYLNQEKLGLFKSILYFSYYTFNGIKKKLL